MTQASAANRLVARLARAWRERAIVLKAVSFAAVGVINTSVDAGVFFLALWVLVGSPSRAGAGTLVAANVFSWSVAISGSYVMNSFVTFAKESGRQLRLKSYATFVAGGIVGAIGNTTALVVVAQFAPVWVAKACAILVSFVLNFSMSHFVVFRAHHPKPRDAARPL
ncbi:MAG TPA: GtrA family protein [Xanthobacteraceae bacterium]|nr:GtrA family protein [Xanthobacteraceae bacterium]